MTASSGEVKKIYFITSNKKKLDEVNDLLGSHPKFEASVFFNF
jgi:inosine/xanthosine triphosphate pyrophosphatase family protein